MTQRAGVPFATQRTPVLGLGDVLEPRSGYRFRPENLVVPDLVSFCPQPSTVLDLGAGCGVLGLLAGVEPGGAPRASVEAITLVERQPELAALCRANAGLSHASVAVVEQDLRSADLPVAHFDLVLANPPFFAPEHGRPSSVETTRLGTHAHHGGVAEFCARAAAALTPEGNFWLLYPSEALADALLAIQASGLVPRGIFVLRARHTGRPYRAWIRSTATPVDGPDGLDVREGTTWTRR